jgi:hypothetical protein
VVSRLVLVWILVRWPFILLCLWPIDFVVSLGLDFDVMALLWGFENMTGFGQLSFWLREGSVALVWCLNVRQWVGSLVCVALLGGVERASADRRPQHLAHV